GSAPERRRQHLAARAAAGRHGGASPRHLADDAQHVLGPALAALEALLQVFPLRLGAHRHRHQAAQHAIAALLLQQLDAADAEHAQPRRWRHVEAQRRQQPVTLSKIRCQPMAERGRVPRPEHLLDGLAHHRLVHGGLCLGSTGAKQPGRDQRGDLPAHDQRPREEVPSGLCGLKKSTPRSGSTRTRVALTLPQAGKARMASSSAAVTAACSAAVGSAWYCLLSAISCSQSPAAMAAATGSGMAAGRDSAWPSPVVSAARGYMASSQLSSAIYLITGFVSWIDAEPRWFFAPSPGSLGSRQNAKRGVVHGSGSARVIQVTAWPVRLS